MSRTDAGTALLAGVERLYALAKIGRWEEVWVALVGEADLAAACSRYVKPTSGWTFLHQAAYGGNELAVRVLLRLGASLCVQSKEHERPRHIAAKRGHAALSALLGAAEDGGAGLWEPSPDPDRLPASGAWRESRERRAWRELRVGYGGGCVTIPAGARYYVDSFERVLVGWHGSYDPPSGMDGERLL